MGTKLSLTIAVGIFLVTMLLFAAAMVIASALSIPEPAARFLPFSARGLPEAPSEQPSSGLSLTNDLQPGGAQSQGEPVPTVTAVPELPSRTPSMVSSGGVVSSTHTRTAVHRPATTRKSGSEGPGRFWSWPGLNRLAPREPISTPSPTPSPEATPRSPTSKSPESEPAASEPAPTEPATSEPAPSEPAASEPAPSEPAAPPASELATELPGP
jgi:hypothetical protein